MVWSLGGMAAGRSFPSWLIDSLVWRRINLHGAHRLEVLYYRCRVAQKENEFLGTFTVSSKNLNELNSPIL